MTQETKLTGWFPAGVKPVRDGWYQTWHPKFGGKFCQWSNKRFVGWHHGALICNYEFQSQVIWQGMAK
jgi:hypothetical protein